MKKILAITAAAAAATVTFGGLAAAPAMASPCRFHANPAACRERRQIRHFRQELGFRPIANGPGWGDYVHGPYFGGGGFHPHPHPHPHHRF